MKIIIPNPWFRTFAEGTDPSIVDGKLDDALVPGYQVEFDPDEAELSGPFADEALSLHDALDSTIDLVSAEGGGHGA